MGLKSDILNFEVDILNSVIVITTVLIIIIIVNFIIRTYNDIAELKELRTSAFDNLGFSLNKRYNDIEDILNFCKQYITDENRFVVKLLQIKLLPVEQKLEVENDLIKDLRVLLNEAIESQMFNDSEEFKELRIRLAKSEKIIFEAMNALNLRTDVYNKKINNFPNILVAKLAKFKELPEYDIDFITRKP